MPPDIKEVLAVERKVARNCLKIVGECKAFLSVEQLAVANKFLEEERRLVKKANSQDCLLHLPKAGYGYVNNQNKPLPNKATFEHSRQPKVSPNFRRPVPVAGVSEEHHFRSREERLSAESVCFSICHGSNLLTSCAGARECSRLFHLYCPHVGCSVACVKVPSTDLPTSRHPKLCVLPTSFSPREED
jgi:hypothetical protein